MSGATDAAEEAAKKARETASEVGETKAKLEDMRQKVGVLTEAGDQLRKLATEFRDLDKREIMRRVVGLVGLVTLGLFFKKEDIEHFRKGQEDTKEGETTEGNPAEEERHAAEAETPQQEGEGETDFQPDEVISRKQCATNMYAIRYYNEDKTVHEKPNDLGKICIKEKAIPSTYILERSAALFKEGIGTFDFFKKNVSDKLVQASVKDPQERIRQAAVILSCCAIGRFQIVPTYHFKKMGWPTRGEEGLRAMYEYIRSTDRQVALFKKIIEGQWNRYQDIGLVAVAYYAGEGVANAYKKNPKSPQFTEKQYGGHCSIDFYANKARKNFDRYKQELPGLSDIDYAAMTIEANETDGGFLYERAKKGEGVLTGPQKRRGTGTKKPEGTRPVTNKELTPELEAAATEALNETNGQPIGTEVRKVVNGKTYVLQRQVHYNRNPNGAPGIGAFEVTDDKSA